MDRVETRRDHAAGVLASAALAVSPAGASAAAPWGEPQTIPGAAGFGAAEAISPADVDVPRRRRPRSTPSAAAIVVFSRLTPPIVQVAARPAGR